MLGLKTQNAGRSGGMSDSVAKKYYKKLIEEWQSRINEIDSRDDPESQSRIESEVLEEIIFQVSLGLPLL